MYFLLSVILQSGFLKYVFHSPKYSLNVRPHWKCPFFRIWKISFKSKYFSFFDFLFWFNPVCNLYFKIWKFFILIRNLVKLHFSLTFFENVNSVFFSLYYDIMLVVKKKTVDSIEKYFLKKWNSYQLFKILMFTFRSFLLRKITFDS